MARNILSWPFREREKKGKLAPGELADDAGMERLPKKQDGIVSKCSNLSTHFSLRLD